MNINVELENCYGIKKLKHSFDFGSRKVFAIYASNGTMKTSFAKTFSDLQANKDSKDEIYDRKTSIREISKNNDPLDGKEVFVIKPYQESYQSEEIAELLINETLKKKYDSEYKALKQEKEDFLNLISEISGLSSHQEIEQQVCTAFYPGEKDKFLPALARIEKEVKEEEPLYTEILYSDLFNEKTKEIIEDNDFLQNIESYIEKYEALLEQSTFFKKGIFNHIQASKVATELEKNGFFNAEHSILLHGEEQKITTKQALEAIIDREKEQILNNKQLQQEFDKLDKKLKKNQDLQKFREYLANNPQIIKELINPLVFKAKLWKGYFKEKEAGFINLLEKFESSKGVLSEIREQAQQEKSSWDKVVREFNSKFFVPFSLHVENKITSMLDGEDPKIAFKFEDEPIEEKKLIDVLSQGEKRALYILNILFEVEIRKQQPQDCLFIIDDIADSFDYKNKYAIIEYLNEISKNPNFYSIILTHNFDFYRSVCSRLDMLRKHKLVAEKNDQGIKVVEEKYQKQPFETWRKNLKEPKFLLASTPMVRNLFEYSGKTDGFEKITNFLHIKPNTKELTTTDLKEIYEEILQKKHTDNIEENNNYYETLIKVCDEYLENSEATQLEGKIILSIAIRLLAEEFMISEINDPSCTEEIKENQTRKLFDKYKAKFSDNENEIKCLERVNLMTPENIHLNSFMYEPILDMGDEELKGIYREIKGYTQMIKA